MTSSQARCEGALGSPSYSELTPQILTALALKGVLRSLTGPSESLLLREVYPCTWVIDQSLFLDLLQHLAGNGNLTKMGMEEGEGDYHRCVGGSAAREANAPRPEMAKISLGTTFPAKLGFGGWSLVDISNKPLPSVVCQ